MIVSDSDYLKQLEIIRKIRDTTTATDEINLPQICVIGDQSSGKSSFLSRLTGKRSAHIKVLQRNIGVFCLYPIDCSHFSLRD